MTAEIPSPLPRTLVLCVGILLLSWTGCIRSVCEQSVDCGKGQTCETATGKCVRAECVTISDCPTGKICERDQCVAGCLSDQECGAGRCIDLRCRALGTPSTQPTIALDAGAPAAADSAEPAVRCPCPLAPEICLDDINPASVSFARKRCIAAASDHGVVLFFGNVTCSHCQSIFKNLLGMSTRLRGDQLQPTLAFVQLKTFTHTPAVVSATFPMHHGPVLQDTESDDAWSAYAADWYDVIIVDSHGCLGQHYRSDQTFQLSGSTGQEVEAAWRRSLSNECP